MHQSVCAFLNNSIEGLVLFDEYPQRFEKSFRMAAAMFVMLDAWVANPLLDFAEEMLRQVVLPVVLGEAVVDRFEDRRVIIVKRLFSMISICELFSFENSLENTFLGISMGDGSPHFIRFWAASFALGVEAELVMIIPAAGEEINQFFYSVFNCNYSYILIKAKPCLDCNGMPC